MLGYDLYEIFDARTGQVHKVMVGREDARDHACAMGGKIDFERAQGAYYIAKRSMHQMVVQPGPFAFADAAQSACDMLNRADDRSSYEVVRNSNYGRL